MSKAPKKNQPKSSKACYVGPLTKKGVKAKQLNLALQGGGAHGAFTWGVLDKLLEDGRIEFEAISATSAGAMNAVAFAYGSSIGGYEGAREKLEEFWTEISKSGQIFTPLKPSGFENWFGFKTPDYSAGFHMFEAMRTLWSPYQFNPMNFNPLKDVLEKVIDFDHLQKCQIATRLHLSATNIRTGKVRIFESHEISADTVLASACLPFLFHAVKIDGEHYWDGGYMGNPALFPLIYNTITNDVLIVHINPLERDEVPITAPEIYNRVNEISFNSSLMREMRAIAFVTKLLDEGKIDETHYNRMYIHAISNDDVMTNLSLSSKLNPDWDFIANLKDEGRKTAQTWIDEHFDKIGTESSIDIRDHYL